MTTLSRLGAALLVCAGATQFASAQVITNGEIERGLRPGSPAGSDPYTARYSYGLGDAYFYVNGNSKQLAYLDYLDRVDRAAKFGYPMPVDPFFGGPPIPHPDPTVTPPRTFIGGMIQSLRRR
jgi:hypothetical protein